MRKNINTSIENLSVRLCDFGLSSTLEKSFLLSTRCGSPAWIAPEVMVGRFYDQRIDIYAFGLVMWEIMVGLFIDQFIILLNDSFSNIFIIYIYIHIYMYLGTWCTIQ